MRQDSRGGRIQQTLNRRPPFSALPGFVLGAAFCLAGVPVFAPAAQAPPGIEARVRISPTQATVGDLLVLEVAATGPPGSHGTAPPLQGKLGDFTVLGTLPPPGSQEGTADPAVVLVARYSVAVYQPGEFEFPPLTVKIRLPDSREVDAKTPPVKVRIQSVLTEQDATLRDLKKQAEIEDPYRWLWWVVPALLLAAAGALLWWWRRRRRPAAAVKGETPAVDPFALAEAELRALLQQRLIESGQVKAFYVSLSDISKRLLEAGFGVSTQEKTTPEIVGSLEALASAGGAVPPVPRVQRFLEACDLVKFAKYVPTSEENDQAVADAFDLLKLASERRPSRADVAVVSATAPAG